ncbi:lycopene cyclase family protein [Ectopseudomonas mendocina]|uniref:Lycopene cyclase family protein n=1 Tax=Ectopseudomonas mendocina TaxID=300 RepID=A0ABZ2RIK0_ECTME
MSDPIIAVLGAGPAGCAVALGLRRLGYQVRVVGEWRRFAAVEGISARVLEGLRQVGLNQALASAAAPTPRRVLWNGLDQIANTEQLLDRPLFDAALRRDLAEGGVAFSEGRVRQLVQEAGRHRVVLDSGESLLADFLVEARGRQAPLSKGRVRGPETVSLLSTWQGRAGRPGSAVESLEDGWAWMAALDDGRCYWQITLDAGAAELPSRDALDVYCAARRQSSALAAELFGDSVNTQAPVYARSSTAILAQQVVGENWIRVGDAAMAVDPLSGNGVFQSLSSALQAPAVINTLLQHPGRAELASRFHHQRVEHLFMRFARTGRDFYAMEQRWPEHGFWQARRSWPDAEPMHAAADFEQLRVARMPVLNDGLIDEAEVVITADQPLGIWHINGVALAPIVRSVQAGQLEKALELLQPAQKQMIQGWLLQQGYRP